MNTDKNSSLEEALAIAKTKAEKPFKKSSYFIHTSHLNDEQVQALLGAGWWTLCVLDFTT